MQEQRCQSRTILERRRVPLVFPWRAGSRPGREDHHAWRAPRGDAGGRAWQPERSPEPSTVQHVVPHEAAGADRERYQADSRRVPGAWRRGTDFSGLARLADSDVSAPGIGRRPPCRPPCHPSCGTSDRSGSGGDEPGGAHGRIGPGGPQTLRQDLSATRNRCRPGGDDAPRQTTEQGAKIPADRSGWTGTGFARTSRRCLTCRTGFLRGKCTTTGNSGASCQDRRPIAQSEERRTRTAEVVGSNTIRSTKHCRA